MTGRADVARLEQEPRVGHGVTLGRLGPGENPLVRRPFVTYARDIS